MAYANYLKKGSWNVICDRCGFKFKVEQCKWETRFGKKTFFVCRRCWDPQHPQDFVKGIPDPQKVPIVRPRPDIKFVD